MDLRFTTEEQDFREMVRVRLHTEIPLAVRDRIHRGAAPDRIDILTSHKMLSAWGWAVPHWPLEWGGRDWTAVQRIILHAELGLARLPPPLPANVSMLGPVLTAFGSQGQKERFLRRAANLDDWWCLGFADHGARPGLVSPQLSAIHTADGYLVSGQQVLVAYAEHADWMLALVHTDLRAKAERGFSLLLIDMKSPGITLRPSARPPDVPGIHAVAMDRVEVPFENLVGAEHHGRDYATFLLGHERSNVAGTGVVKELAARIRHLARGDDPDFKLTTLEAELAALETLQLRVGASHCLDGAVGVAVSMLKVKGSELQQRALAMLMALGGAPPDTRPAHRAEVGRRHTMDTYAHWWGLSVSCGSDDTHRDLLAREMLGTWFDPP